MAKDYIIFEQAPVINFSTTTPFECDGNFNSVSAWYSAQSRNTPKPRPKIYGSITTTNCDEQYTLHDINANLSVHGNYTAYYRKKSFKLQFNISQNLFGLNKGRTANNWLLMADYGDNSMLRNAVALYMGQQFLRTAWSATFTFVHVYIDNEYYGLYLLTDAKEVADTKVNINAPAVDYQGVDIGYFFERDDYLTYDHKDPGFVISYPNEYLPSPLPVIQHETNKSYGVDATYRDEYSISSKIYSQDQIDFLKKYMCLTYNILYEACINNAYYEISSDDLANWQNWTLVASELTDPIEVVSKVVDLNSFVDIYLLHEIAGNPDLAHSSFYFCLDMSETGDKKLKLCCPWDFDRAFGISNGLMDATSNTLWAKNAHYNPWISLLPQAEWFIDLLKVRYRELQTSNTFSKCIKMLDDYATTYVNDFAQNFTKYSIKWAGDHWNWVNNGSPARIGTLNSSYYQNIETEAEAKDLLKTWISNRVCALYNIFGFQGEDTINNALVAAPILTISYDGGTYPFAEWYTNIVQHSPEVDIPGSITTSNCEDSYILNNVKLEYVRVRGNYTKNYRKKPFKIKFDKKQNLFGLNNGQKYKEWLLLAEYNDSSMLRNILAFFLAKQICPDQWSANCTFVHVFVKDTVTSLSEYLGLYLACDQKEVDTGRVDINKPSKNYTGVDIGYFFERDDYFRRDDPDEVGFSIKTYTGVEFPPFISEYLPAHLPVDMAHVTTRFYGTRGGALREYMDAYTMHSKTYSQDQLDFIKKYVCLIYTIVYEAAINNTYYELSSTDITDWENWELVESELTDPIEVVSKVIDLESFINRYIFEEICCNTDLAHSSFYFTLDASETGNKKLTLNCIWDNDLSFGINWGLSDPTQIGLFAKGATANPWISVLPRATWFMNLVEQRWQNLCNKYVFGKSLALLDNYSIKYRNDFAKNFEKYDIHFGQDSGRANPIEGAGINEENYSSTILTEADCKNLLKTWMQGRFTKLNELFNCPIAASWTAGPIPEVSGIYLYTEPQEIPMLSPVDLFGSVKLLLGKEVSHQNVEEIVYNLRSNKYWNAIRLDLETGGELDSSVNGYRRWFPGSETYGFNDRSDITVYADEESVYEPDPSLKNYLEDVDHNQVMIPEWGGGTSKEEATFRILTVLDAVNTDSTLKNRLKLVYKVKLNNGAIGYIAASAVNNIFYRPKPEVNS